MPTAQTLFAVPYRLAPESSLAFQVVTALVDLLTGLLVIEGLLWEPERRIRFVYAGRLQQFD